MLTGGTVLTMTEVAHYNGALPAYFTHIKDDATFDTGDFYSYSNQENFYYSTLRVDNLLLLVQLSHPADESRTDYLGTLKELTGELRDEITRQLSSQIGNGRRTFLPLYLDVRDVEQRWIWLGGGALLVAGILIGVYLNIQFTDRQRNPSHHPIMKRLSRFNTEVDLLLSRVDGEMQTKSVKVGSLILTENWMIHQTFFTLDMIPFADIAWIYRSIIRTKYYGIITVAKNYGAVVHERYGAPLNIRASDDAVWTMLDHIAQRAPWAIYGYSDDLKMIWNHDRVDFLRLVDKRKASRMNQTESSQTGSS